MCNFTLFFFGLFNFIRYGRMKSEKEILREIGLRFELLRKEKGFTSYEHFANEYNLSRMHYWKIEKGKANITIKTLTHLLNIHHCTIEDFFKILIPHINESEKENKSNTN